MNFTDSYTPLPDLQIWQKFIKLLMASPHQVWTLYEFQSNKYNSDFQVPSTSEEQ